MSAAFAVQTAIAVGLGHAASFLPQTPVRLVAAALFLAGAVLLVREGRSHHRAVDDEPFEVRDVTGWRAVLASFLVLFAAEWGDLSQLLTVSLVARYADPVAVFVGALAALLSVSGLAVLTGQALLRVVSLHVLHYVGAAICLTLAGVTVAAVLA